MQYFRFAKGEIKKHVVETERSDHARLRFEARQDRLDKELAEKEAKRKARAEKTAKAKAAKAQKAALEPTSTEGVTTNPEDQSKILKTAMAKSTKLWKDAEKALSVVESSATEEQKNQLEAHRAKVDRLKEKAEKTQRAFKEFKAKATAPPATTPAATETPLTERKVNSDNSEKQA